MKVNELMIGDYVRHSNGNIMQVTCIRLRSFACGMPHCWNYNNSYSPIPLTKSILEANGFSHKSGTFAWWREGFCLHCQIDGNAPYSVELARYTRVPYIQYIHELQHVLRLCGLSDFANNLNL